MFFLSLPRHSLPTLHNHSSRTSAIYLFPLFNFWLYIFSFILFVRLNVFIFYPSPPADLHFTSASVCPLRHPCPLSPSCLWLFLSLSLPPPFLSDLEEMGVCECSECREQQHPSLFTHLHSCHSHFNITRQSSTCSSFPPPPSS